MSLYSTGINPVLQQINITSNILQFNSSNFTLATSNILQLNSSNFTYNTSNILENHLLNTSNILQVQITDTHNLIFKDNDCNTNIKITAQNVNYPAYGNPIELYFKTVEDNCITKLNQSGELMVYHPISIIPVGYNAGWWSVENKLSGLIQDGIGLRLDITNLQVFTTDLSSTLATTTSTASTALATATLALGQSTTNAIDISSIKNTIPTLISSNVLNSQNYINSNSIQNILSFYSPNLSLNSYPTLLYLNGYSSNFISSNILSNQNYINSNTISSNYLSSNILPNLISSLITSNILNSQKFINSNSVSLNYINSNSIPNIISSLITSNVLSLNYINSNSIPNIISSLITSNVLNSQNFINSNSVSLNYINSNTIPNIISSLITSNVLSYQQFINSNSVANNYISSNILKSQNYINSNSVANITSYYISSNALQSQNYINSNSVANILVSYLPLYRIFLSHNNFTYYGAKAYYVYDLKISDYVGTYTFSRDTGMLVRTFEITTIIENTDWDYANAVLNQGFFETITIYMSNFKYVNGTGTVLPNFCNGKITGKQNSTNIGYWNTMIDNFNYIRFISQIGWDMNVSIRPLF